MKSMKNQNKIIKELEKTLNYTKHTSNANESCIGEKIQKIKIKIDNIFLFKNIFYTNIKEKICLPHMPKINHIFTLGEKKI